MRQSGIIEDGGVYVSTSGRLPCKKVIHAVGPVWKGGSSNEENNLYDAVYESMLAAEQYGLSSIGLPALSSGVFGYPIDKSTKIIIMALMDFLEANTQSCVKKVSLLDPTEHVVRAFHTSLGVVFGSQMVMTSRQDSSQKKGKSFLLIYLDSVLKCFVLFTYLCLSRKCRHRLRHVAIICGLV